MWRLFQYLILLITFVIHASIGQQSVSSADDEVTSLPGLKTKPKFRQYSGYLQATGTKHLHYWFVESTNSPETDPVVLWLNGGPGCSSLEGFLTENGPFRVSDDGRSLYYDDYSWNRLANMLYLESPAGVGFSYADDANYTTDDDQVATENHAAILSFFEKFPHLRMRDFYISGESYAGIYIPTLMVRLIKDKRIKVKGALIGNGYMNPELLEATKLPYWYYHGIIDTEMWREVQSACCNNANGSDCQYVPYRNVECQKAVIDVNIKVMLTPINPYNIHGCCEGLANEATKKRRAVALLSLIFQQMVKKVGIKELEKQQLAAVEEVTHKIPCSNDTNLERYLNDATVRRALHIPEQAPSWTTCSPVVSTNPPISSYTRLYDDMSPFFHKILETGTQRMLIFNGDLDTVCNFYGDEQFVDNLKLEERRMRQAWHYTSQAGTIQVGGFVHEYKDLVYLTVKGAGHMVPTDKPLAALIMFETFINNKSFQ